LMPLLSRCIFATHLRRNCENLRKILRLRGAIYYWRNFH